MFPSADARRRFLEDLFDRVQARLATDAGYSKTDIVASMDAVGLPAALQRRISVTNTRSLLATANIPLGALSDRTRAAAIAFARRVKTQYGVPGARRWLNALKEHVPGAVWAELSAHWLDRGFRFLVPAVAARLARTR